MAAISPAVVIPCLFSLQDRGYGKSKGIPTLVIAAAAFDDVIAVSAFSVVLNIIFSTGENYTCTSCSRKKLKVKIFVEDLYLLGI
jgi:NhaP-type Na+/H+ or K+/H+ antiporter